MNKEIIDQFSDYAAKVINELLEYAQYPTTDRDEGNDGQVRRLRGINGAVTSALEATRVQPGMPAPTYPATAAQSAAKR